MEEEDKVTFSYGDQERIYKGGTERYRPCFPHLPHIMVGFIPYYI